VRREFVVQNWEEIDHADAGVGLGGPYAQTAVGKVDIAPTERGDLADSQAGKDKRGQQGPAVGDPALVRMPAGSNGLVVKLSRCLEQSLDLLGAVEPDRRRLLRAQAPAPRCPYLCTYSSGGSAPIDGSLQHRRIAPAAPVPIPGSVRVVRGHDGMTECLGSNGQQMQSTAWE
jgi:hypothetical protein